MERGGDKDGEIKKGGKRRDEKEREMERDCVRKGEGEGESVQCAVGAVNYHCWMQ